MGSQAVWQSGNAPDRLLVGRVAARTLHFWSLQAADHPALLHGEMAWLAWLNGLPCTPETFMSF